MKMEMVYLTHLWSVIFVKSESFANLTVDGMPSQDVLQFTLLNLSITNMWSSTYKYVILKYTELSNCCAYQPFD